MERTKKDNALLCKMLDLDIDDSLPYMSDADIAEAIRVWMENTEFVNQVKYARCIRDGQHLSELTIEVMSEVHWSILGIQAAPQDKITAALKVWQETHKGETK